jgi:hypothetical protein
MMNSLTHVNRLCEWECLTGRTEEDDEQKTLDQKVSDRIDLMVKFEVRNNDWEKKV